MKTIYQLIALLFNYFAVKKLSVIDFGTFSYFTSMIVFFSSLIVIGMPTYIQKHIARKQPLDSRYMFAIFILIPLIAALIYFFMIPVSMVQLKYFTLAIIIINGITSLTLAVSNGNANFTIQYKMLLVSSVWSLALLAYIFFFKQAMTLRLIFDFWVVNAIISLFYAIYILFSFKKTITFISNFKEKYQFIFINLFLIYAVSLPYEFSRVYDRFLIAKYFTPHLLGVYAFNCYIVMAVYSLMIRPLATICVTGLSAHIANIDAEAKIIFRYYLYILAIYFLIFVGYVPFSKEWLEMLGLYNYIGTTDIFLYVFFSILIFNISIPLTIKISLLDSHLTKMIYCCGSLLLFNVSFLFILIKHSFEIFLAGFLLAYFLHLMLCIILNYRYSLQISIAIGQQIYKLAKGGHAELKSFIAATDEL